MTDRIMLERKNVWPYIIWSIVILNLGGLLVIGGMYAFFYARAGGYSPQLSPPSFGQTQFILSMFIVLVEWSLALIMITRYRKAGASIRELFTPSGSIFRFRIRPAFLLFLVVNAVFVAYIVLLIRRMPDLTYKDLALWQKILFLTLVPLTAAFTEELIWRGHIISGFELRGRSTMQAVLLSALSFALIHGVFMPDRLLMTFLFGIVAGYYYIRERNLVPLMFTHWLVDLWGFGVFLII